MACPLAHFKLFIAGPRVLLAKAETVGAFCGQSTKGFGRLVREALKAAGRRPQSLPALPGDDQRGPFCASERLLGVGAAALPTAKIGV